MSNITLNRYPVFENNQVLTSSQLNELATYLDQQTRLTRSCLIGIGAVCGLQPNYDVVVNHLTISAGTGITSLGFLINTGDCEFSQYRTYSLPVGTQPYSPFINTLNNQQVPMWELLRPDYVPMPNETVAPLNFTFVNGVNADDKKVVILFLEAVPVHLDSCLGKSCDAAGIEFTFTLRKLLVRVGDLKIILSNTGPFDLTFVGKFDLPDLLSQRPLFDPLLNNSKDYFAFSQDFRDAAKSIYRRDGSSKDLLNVLRQCYTVFEPIFQDIYNNVNPFNDNQIPNLNIWNEILDGVNSVTNGPSYFGIQYLYDFFRDLVLAYNEFRDSAFELMSDCCFDQRLFPMHLVLGEAIPLDPDKPSIYRDDFVGVPLTPEQRFAKAELICYFNRMVLMVRMFDINRIHKNDTAAQPTTLITPSYEKHGKLSERSIPYYYKINDVDPQLGKLEKFWNFQNIRRNKDVSGEYPVVAYGNQNSNQTAPIDPIQTPLFFDLDQFNFLRIEGALGKDFNAVLTNVNNLKNAFDLPFNIVAVRLQGTSSADEIMQRCNFNDLRSQYVAYRNELYCWLNKFYDHFFDSSILVASSSSKSDTGTAPVNPVKQVPTFIRQLLADSVNQTGPGNSSASLMPAYFALPNQSLPRFIPPIVYSPTPLQSLTSSLGGNYLPQLRSRLLQLKNVLLTEQLDDFNYGADNPNIDESFIGSYIEAVSLCNICKALFNQINDEITHSTNTRFNQELYFTYSQWVNEELYFLNEFILDCRFRKLEAVSYERDYRVNYLQTNDPTVFSNFIKRNPGIDHKAGVPLGGTFVIVYPGKSLNFSVKIKEQLAFQLMDIKFKEVRREQLRAIQGRSEAESVELVQVEAQLCELYAAQVHQPGRPFTLGAAVSAVSVQHIAIEANQVIADFALPYLSNCECECEDIPAPTTLELGIPSIVMPAFFEYHVGDYAFPRDIITSTFGCTTPAQLTIDVHSSINYDQINKQEGGIVKLKFVVNGNSQNFNVDVLVRSSSNTISSKRLGTVQVVTGATGYDVFLYTPPRNFLGIDSFEYVFEVYDRNNNIVLRSHKALVTISVTGRCSVPIAAVPFEGNTAQSPD